ncbi:MAG: biotin/lipoyl-binding protein, partial [Rhizobium sp.]
MADSSSIRRPTSTTDTIRAVPSDEVAEAQPVNPGAAPVAVAPTVVDAGVPRKRRNPTRTILFAALPVVLVIGGYYYVVGGQTMSTDNAYVGADMVGVSTDVGGLVASIEVQENELVKKGQVLFRLKPDSFQIALEGAKAQLGVARNQILNLQASYQQTLAEIAQAEADLPFFQTSFERQQSLINSSAASKAVFDSAKHDLDAARQKVAVAKAQAASTLAQIGGDVNQPLEQNPTYLQAKAAVDDAQRQLDDTIVRASFDGIVTNVNSLQVGAYLAAAQQGFSLVSSDK